MRPSKVKEVIAVLWLLAAMLLLGAVVGIKAHADPIPPNCQVQPWWRGEAMRMTQRIICDGPIQGDGSWTRKRDFYAPSYYVPFRCNFSYYGGGCSGDYWVQEYDSGIETYLVRPDNVLPDEPGHIG